MSVPVSYDVDGYEGFRRRAQDLTLSANEKAGFPDSYRSGAAENILADIDAKLPGFGRRGARVLDIGIGCSELSYAIVRRAIDLNQHLTIIDSQEILDQLDDGPQVEKLEGPFPSCLDRTAPIGPFDAIVAYSVVQYVFVEASIFRFIDRASALLAESDAGFLIGDVPNTSMRKRFLASAAGQAFHELHFPSVAPPSIAFNVMEQELMDDSVVLGVLARARAAGLQAFVLPQAADLPMANRREDILIRRP